MPMTRWKITVTTSGAGAASDDGVDVERGTAITAVPLN